MENERWNQQLLSDATRMRSVCSRELLIGRSHANIIIFEQPCKLEELREQFRITLTTTIKKERCQEQEVEPPGQQPT